MRIAVQTSLPVGGPDSIKNLQPPGAILLSGTNAAQLAVELSSGFVTLTPHWWSQVLGSWVPASEGYQLSVSFAIDPSVSDTFSRASEPQWWAILKTGGGTVVSCDLAEATATSSGGVVAVTATSPIAVTAGSRPVISLSDPVPANKGGTGVSTGNANLVFATPDGSAGEPGFRRLTAADVPSGLPGLFFDQVVLGEASGWSSIGGNYVWGAAYQALADLTVTGVKARTQQTSGTLVLSVWVANVRVKTVNVTITAAGVYTGTFNSSLAVVAGATFVVSAYTVNGTIPYVDAPAELLSIPVAGPKIRLLDSRRYATGNVEPTSTSGVYLFGCVPIIGG